MYTMIAHVNLQKIAAECAEALPLATVVEEALQLELLYQSLRI